MGQVSSQDRSGGQGSWTGVLTLWWKSWAWGDLRPGRWKPEWSLGSVESPFSKDLEKKVALVT